MNPERKQERVEELYDLEEQIRADLWRLGMYGSDNERAQHEIRRSNADLKEVQNELRELLAADSSQPN